MSSAEDREKHSQRRKRNKLAQILRDPGEHRGAFSLKVIDSKKQIYKRRKLRVTEVNDIESENDEN